MVLQEKDIYNIIIGSALLAAGGGGSVTDGLDLLQNYKNRNPGKKIQVEMIDVTEMDDTACAVGIAGMGAPTKGANKDFTPCAASCYDEVSQMAVRMGKVIKYVMPIEMGGFNTFAPMLASLDTGFPTVDADGAGRAVPGLDTALMHVNGYDTSPIAMADEFNNRVEIIMNDPRNATGAQKIAAPIANGYFEGNACIAGWMMNKSQIQDALPTGTVTLAKRIGEIIEDAIKEKSNGYVAEIFEMINKLLKVESRAITKIAKITDYSPNPNPSFDNGYYYIDDGTDRFKVAYENENLVLYKSQDGKDVPFMTTPDIITMYNAKTGEPITNEDIDQQFHAGRLDDLEIVAGIMRVDNKWWKNPENVDNVWREYFADVGYTGGVIRYPAEGVK